MGSEFEVRLPAITWIREEPKLRSETPLDGDLATGNSLKILVVDDSPSVASTLAMVLTDWRHVVETSADGFAALEAVRRFKPDLILADLGMNGYQFAEEVRRVPEMQHITLIAVSGYGQKSDREHSRAVGSSRHLVKPVNLHELREILAQHAAPAVS